MMPMPRFSVLCALPCALLLLSGCGGKGSNAQDILGVSRSGPDAFNVVSRPPLTLPPEFTLRPPAPNGTPGPGETNSEQAARTLLTGEDAAPEPAALGAPKASTAVIGVKSATLTGSPAERKLLERFGAKSGDDSIRAQLDRDAVQKQDDKSWMDSVIPTFRKKKDDALDPIEETQRLRSSDDKDVVQAPPDELLPDSAAAKNTNMQPNVAKGADAKKAAAKGDFGIGLAPGRQ